jgi:hypothetical protein
VEAKAAVKAVAADDEDHENDDDEADEVGRCRLTLSNPS